MSEVLEVGGRRIEVDAEGFLLDPADWDETVAEAIAAREGITLTEEHWAVIRFMRAWLDEHGVAPAVRHTIRFVSDELRKGREGHNHLFRLFPLGYMQQACKIAGMKRPRAWSTG